MFWTFPILSVSSVWQIVPIWWVYESFIFPTFAYILLCLGSNGPVGPIYIRPVYALWTKDIEANIQRYWTLKSLFLSHFLGDILLKAANGPILVMMTLRPHSCAVGSNFCRQFWVNSKKINKIFKFQEKLYISPFLLTINKVFSFREALILCWAQIFTTIAAL